MEHGSCHCGNVELRIPYISKTACSCNCSICQRYGAIWGYFEEAEVEVRVGPAGLSSYSHGDRQILFCFCAKCGCITHYLSADRQPRARLAVNYRAFPQQALGQLKIRHFDGADTWQYLD